MMAWADSKGMYRLSDSRSEESGLVKVVGNVNTLDKLTTIFQEQGLEFLFRSNEVLPDELVNEIIASHRDGFKRRPYADQHLEVNYDTMTATVKGQPAGLTATEFRLLSKLTRNAGITVIYASIITEMWSDHCDGKSLVKKYVEKLRKKVENDPKHPTRIVTHRDVGIRYVPEIGLPGKGIDSLGQNTEYSVRGAGHPIEHGVKANGHHPV